MLLFLFAGRVVIIVGTVAVAAAVFCLMMLGRIGYNCLGLLQILQDAYQRLDGVVYVIGCESLWQVVARLQLMQNLCQRGGAYVGQLIRIIRRVEHLTRSWRSRRTLWRVFVDGFELNRRRLGRLAVDRLWRRRRPRLTGHIDILGRNLDRLAGRGRTDIDWPPGSVILVHRRHRLQAQRGLLFV